MKIDRRTLLKAGLAAALPTIVPASALGRGGAVAPSSRIVMGLIGAGGRGTQMLQNFLPWPEVQFVAVCEVNAERRERARKIVDDHYGHRDCAVHHDLRELLARPEIDAVLIATGERWHAPASILAAGAGKDIYSEKPMSLTIAEGRAVVEAVTRHARVYQCGTQRRSVGNFAYAVELARSGRLGRLKTLYACTSGMGTVNDWLPAEPEPPREVLDWDAWLGAAPWRPYNSAYTTHMGAWKNFADLGGGGIADWGSHTADLCQWANDCDHTTPLTYAREGERIVATYANGVKLIWQDKLGPGTCGIRLEGEDGWIYTDDSGNIEVHPESLRPGRVSSEAWTRVVGHVSNFLDCVRTRRDPIARAEVAHHSTSACHVANICLALDRPVAWDPELEVFIGDAEANRLRSRAMRQPWGV